MTFKYDETADALYIRFTEGIADRTVELDPGTLVDVDNSGATVGVEIIRPARSWPIDALLERGDVDEPDAEVLRALFGKDRPFPFVERVPTPA